MKVEIYLFNITTFSDEKIEGKETYVGHKIRGEKRYDNNAHHIIKQYGKKNIRVSILETKEIDNLEECLILEQKWIDIIDPTLNKNNSWNKDKKLSQRHKNIKDIENNIKNVIFIFMNNEKRNKRENTILKLRFYQLQEQLEIIKNS